MRRALRVELNSNDMSSTELYDHIGTCGCLSSFERFWTRSKIICRSLPLQARVPTHLSQVINHLQPARSHSTLSLTKVHAWGLVSMWRGSDATLKSVMFAAHQGAACDSFLETVASSRRCCGCESRDHVRIEIPSLLTTVCHFPNVATRW